VWKGVLDTFASRMKIQGAELNASFKPGLPPVFLDRDLVEEVFGYIVDNALEAIGGKGAISVTVFSEDGRAVMEVSNTGEPIPADVRGKLFEPFFTTKERGTGLGLAIARRVIESHGGKVFLLDGKQTTFRVEVPFEAPKEKDAPHA
jgi:signal transduction histidine kinase